jgi:cation diffusion facilitator CzcD-associated flavoprotein CzcO
MHALPGMELTGADPTRPSAEVVSEYFDSYEHAFDLRVRRPVDVHAVRAGEDGRLLVETSDGTWSTRALINATGTWTRPFVPFYPGIASFAGEQVHTAHYPGAAHFRGRRVLVVGGGASAVQFLGELAPVTDTLWVTRRPPVWREEFDASAGLAAVTLVEERVRHGLPPASVVSVTGLGLRPQEQEAARLGAYERLPMFERIEADGVRWRSGRFEPVDAILWATGFRAAVDHLAPLGLRTPEGGIALVPVRGNVQGATTAVRDPRVQLVGYGPSASTLGAPRAGRQAALVVSRFLAASESAAAG